MGAIVAGDTYTLTVELGHRNDAPFEASAALLVNGTVVAMATPVSGHDPSRGHWGTFTAMFTGTAAEAGKPITIQLNSGGIQANFDSVKLKGSSPSAVPEASSFIMLGAGLLPVFGMVRRRYLNR